MGTDGSQLIPWPVAPALRPWVRRIIGFRDAGAPVLRREPLMVGCPLVFVFGAPYRLSERAEPSVLSVTRASFMAGVFDSFTMSSPMGPTEGIQIDLSPLGARLLTGVPMHELANLIVPVQDLWGCDMRGLEERLGNIETWNERFHLIESVFLVRLRSQSEPMPEVQWAWNQLVATHGDIRIGSLTEELQWSRKRLRHAFLRDIGFSPKVMARALRYCHAVDLARSHPELGWSQIAHCAGYSDQAHLHRDVRAFAGVTPAALRTELREGTFVQAGHDTRS